MPTYIATIEWIDVDISRETNRLKTNLRALEGILREILLEGNVLLA